MREKCLRLKRVKLKAEWGVPESYIGIGHCVLGYRSGEYPEAKARKDGFVIRV